MSDEKTLKKLQDHCTTLYITYALSVIMQFFEATMMPGLFALIIAYILNGTKKDAARDTVYASHLRWMIRSFWIGTGVFLPLGIIAATYIIIQFTDIMTVIDSMQQGGDPAAMMGNIQNYMDANKTKLTLITAGSMIPAAVWWLRRLWHGYTLAKAEQPVENVTSWG